MFGGDKHPIEDGEPSGYGVVFRVVGQPGGNAIFGVFLGLAILTRDVGYLNLPLLPLSQIYFLEVY